MSEMASTGSADGDDAKAAVAEYIKAWQTQASTFVVPEKHIEDLHSNLALFMASPGGKDAIGFIMALNASVQSLTVADALAVMKPFSAPAVCICDFLAEIKGWIAQIPPQTQEQRFGNKSFRTWLDKLNENAGAWILKILVAGQPEEAAQLVPETLIAELQPYIMASFGDRVRIDYGTGHELTFVSFLCILTKLGVFNKSRFPELVCKVFVTYLDLMRELQSVYWLEPAGSKGVWGLDDYQFLPFVFGSSQLIDNGLLEPECIHNDETIASYASEYLYLDGIRFIKSMKSGPFFEYAPLLNDISGLPSWQKVNSG
jgi:serine/threonine-protein phosphatase 2A activator